MFKKIALVAALAATASFATWDKFPVLENHKGQAKVGFTYGMPEDKATTGDIYAGVRYTVIPNLELATKIDYRLFSHYDGDDAKVDGLANLPIMVRYQFMPIMNAFLDVTLPIGNDEVAGAYAPDENDEIAFHFGVQYSQKFGMVDLGTEAGLKIETAGDDKTTPPWTLNLGAEADFSINAPVVPYVGLDIKMALGKYTYDGDNQGDSHTGNTGLFPYVGVSYAFNPMLTLDVSATFGFGNEDYVKEDTDIYLDANLKINF